MAQLKEVPEVAQLLATVLTAEPITHGALTVVPLLAPNLDDPDWLTLEEALSPESLSPSPLRGEGRVRGGRVRGGDAGSVQITEVNDAGTVPFLKVANGADRPLLLLDGEELIGAKQNRILNTTVLVAARTELAIPVSCVEQGRWGYRGRQFRPGDASLYASMRATKADHVSRSVRAGRGHRADQGVVWSHVAQRAAEHSVESPTGAMRDFYARYDSEITAARQALAAQPGQVGALIYIAGRWVGLDLLAGPRLFARAWSRLCAGYMADAIRLEAKPHPGLDAAALLATLGQAEAESAPAVGLGAEYRIGTPGLAGAALVAQERVVHVMAFPGAEAVEPRK
jgi:hypothetical protein